MTWANPGDRPSQPPLYPPLPPAYPASSGYPGQAGYARVEPAATPNAPQAGEQNVVRPAAVSAPPETASTPAGAGRTPRPGFDSDGRVRTRLDSLQRLSHAKDQRSGRVLHARFIGAAVRSPEAPGRPRLSRRATRLGHQLRFGAGVAADLVGLAYIAAADGHD
jgi:hypothetical protein